MFEPVEQDREQRTGGVRDADHHRCPEERVDEQHADRDQCPLHDRRHSGTCSLLPAKGKPIAVQSPSRDAGDERHQTGISERDHCGDVRDGQQRADDLATPDQCVDVIVTVPCRDITRALQRGAPVGDETAVTTHQERDRECAEVLGAEPAGEDDEAEKLEGLARGPQHGEGCDDRPNTRRGRWHWFR